MAHKKHPNFKGYHHYLGKIIWSQREYYVRFTLQEIKTRRKDIISNQLHSTYVSDIEIYSTDNRVNTGNTPATAKVDAINTDAKLVAFFEKAKKQEKKHQKLLMKTENPWWCIMEQMLPLQNLMKTIKKEDSLIMDFTLLQIQPLRRDMVDGDSFESTAEDWERESDQQFITPQGQVYGYATPEGAIYLDERVIKKSRTYVRDFFIKACPPGQPDCLL